MFSSPSLFTKHSRVPVAFFHHQSQKIKKFYLNSANHLSEGREQETTRGRQCQHLAAVSFPPRRKGMSRVPMIMISVLHLPDNEVASLGSTEAWVRV